jgi:hypothetical protein
MVNAKRTWVGGSGIVIVNVHASPVERELGPRNRAYSASAAGVRVPRSLNRTFGRRIAIFDTSGWRCYHQLLRNSPP